jgi:choice-of-anchor A domain-containing protein
MSISSVRFAIWGRFRNVITAAAVPSMALMLSCGQPARESVDQEVETEQSAVTAACGSSSVKVVDLHADFRDIWKGTETTDTGKQADPNLKVGVDFNTTVQPPLVKAQFVPVGNDAHCGGTVQATLSASVVAPSVWGTATSDVGRAPIPSTFSVLVKDTINGIVSAGGAIAAGGDVTLSSMSINGTAHQPVGLIGGGRVNLSNGSISGDVTYGVASTIPGTVTITGQKSLKTFDTRAAFQSLASLSSLLAEETTNATVTASNGSLQMTGTRTGMNVFQVSADALAQSSSVQITVPSGAGALVNITGNATVSLQNKGVSLQGATAAALLWNIPRAAFVQISSIGLQGSVLAPRALVNFDSGSVNGTIVAAAFNSSGSGSLQFTPLNVSLLLGSATPSAVELTPASPLVRGCTYQFAIPGNVPLTATNGCLSPPLSVTFRVATNVGTPAGRELVSVEADRTLHTLRRFTARPGVNTPVDDVWPRYETQIGIAIANLVPTTTSVPSSTRTGQTITIYQQYAQGYPVVGYGYFVATQGATFRAANGKVMPGLPVFPAPAVTSATALQNMLTYLKISPSQAPWVTKPSLYQAPVGRLVVTPLRLYPTGSDFALAWDFRLGPGTGINEPAGIQIDAATGTVLRADRGEMGVATLAAGATYDGRTVAATVDTVYDGNGRSFQAASYHNPGQSAAVSTLASGNVTAAGVLETVNGVTEDASGNVNTAGTQYVVNPTPATPWNSIGVIEQRMAGLQWALGLSDSFMQSLGLRIAGSPWQTIDGQTPAHQKVIVNYSDSPAPPGFDPAHWSYGSTADAALIFIYRSPPFLFFQADVLAHEYNHALVNDLRRAAGLSGPYGGGTMSGDNETGSINEGVADLFAIAMNHSKLNPNGNWFCISADIGKGLDCIRNIRDPLSSAADIFKTGIAGLPELYKDVAVNYKDFSTAAPNSCNDGNDFCGAHQNSTIVSRWGYLLAIGSGQLSVPCGIKVDALDSADVDGSLRTVLNIALRAIGTRSGLTNLGLSSYATFADFRDATLQVAQEMVDEGTLPITALQKVELAWAAVGLPPSSFHSDVASPANVSGAYPWAKFTWPLDGDGQSATALGNSWDFQITTSTFDNPTFHQEGTTRVGDDNLTAVLPLSLPDNSQDPFYWRVRPHSNLPWEICYPIHSFVGTTVPDPVSDLQAVADLNTSGDVLPGPFQVSWTAVRGTDIPDYNFFIGTQNPGCPAGNDPSKISVNVSGFQESGTITFTVPFVAQPVTHYFLNVQPIGAPGFDGTQPLGDCATLEFDTADLLAPEAVQGTSLQIYNDMGNGLKVFNWTTSGGAVKSLVTVYERDENGNCSSTPIGPAYEVQTNCARGCPLSLFPPSPPGLPNASGYCWDVRDVAATQQFGYEAFVLNPSPGVPWDVPFLDGLNAAVLPSDSYGKDVTFTWTTLPNLTSAPAFGFKLGRYIWPETLSAPEPSNCLDQNQTFDVCFKGPGTDTLYTTTVRGASTVTVPGAQGGRGRYCWTSWPIFDDPNAPGTVGARQPQVLVDLECYTTGPALPRITFPTGFGYSTDPNVPPVGFPGGTIDGTIELDYVPANQLKGTVTANGVDVVDFDALTFCASSSNLSDVYNCKIPVSFHPDLNSTYTFEVKTFNSTASSPVLDDNSMIHDVVTTVKTGSCGNFHEPCCLPRDFGGVIGCNNPGPPNGSNQPLLCDAPFDKGPNLTCNNCGNAGQPCCSGSTALCAPGTHATNDTVGDSIVECGCVSDAPTCPATLEQPQLPIAAAIAQIAAACVTPTGAQEILACFVAGNTLDDPCASYVPTITPGLAWPAVPGATSYEITQVGNGTLNTFTLPAVSGTVETNISLAVDPIAGTVESCGFAGYYVIVAAIDACGHRATGITGIGIF